MTLLVNLNNINTHSVKMSLSGSIDSDTADILDGEIARLLDNAISTLVLDFSDITYISSAGVGVIMKAKTSLTRRKGDLAMINLQPQVKKVFEIIHLLPALNVFESVEELDEYLGKIQRGIIDEDSES